MHIPKARLPIIALDHTSWDGNWMNRQHILSRLGKRGWPIIYSNGAKYYNEVRDTKLIGTIEEKDHVKIFHPGFIMPRNYRFKAFDKLAVKQHCAALKKKAGLKKDDAFIAFCFHPDFYPYVKELNAPYVMFHIYDIYQKLGTVENTNNAQLLIKKANLITAASETMWDEVVGDSHLTPNIIYNGVDFSKYENKGSLTNIIIDKVKGMPGHKIGYVGAINLKVDFELIYNVALKCKENSFIFIGNIVEKPIVENKVASKFYKKCQQSKNIHFLGPVSGELVPHILNLMDVNTIFYTRNDQDWVQAGYPIKINEYLAAGKPVVTSYMPILQECFENNIAICNSVDEWRKAIDLACQGDGVGTVESRKEMAKANDWQFRVNKLEELMFRMLE